MPITIKEVAQKAGVSIATVSNIMNNKDKRYSEATKKRVLDVVSEHNYTPSFSGRALSSQRTKLIACVVQTLNINYWVQIIEGAEAYCAENGYGLMICNANHDQEKVKAFLNTCYAKGVEGIILSYEFDAVREEIQQLQQKGVKIVTSAQVNKAEGVDMVGLDNFLLMLQARRTIGRLGYNKVAYIGKCDETYNGKQLYEGFKQASIEAGADISTLAVYLGDSTQERCYEAMCDLEDQHHDAILLSNSALIAGVDQYYEETDGDNHKPIFVLTPRDSKLEEKEWDIRQLIFDVSGKSIGGLAAQIIVQSIENETVQVRQLIMPTLVEELVKG